MNERWEFHEEFTFEEAILIALEIDGCFESLDELAKIVGQRRGQFIETYPDESQINTFKALDKVGIKRLFDKAQKMRGNLDSQRAEGFFTRDVRQAGLTLLINKTDLSFWLSRIGKQSLSKHFEPATGRDSKDKKMTQLQDLELENHKLRAKLSLYENTDHENLRLSPILFKKAIGAMACAADHAAPNQFRHGGKVAGSKFRSIIVDDLGIADMTNIDKVINQALKHPDIKIYLNDEH